MRRHVRLVMIARNEAESLPSLANAVRSQIDSWIIVIDPRTTDGTEGVAHEVFGGIPGRTFTSKLDDETFDFAAARNEAQDLAREDGVYLLWLDPDTPLVGTLPKELTAPVYYCDVRDENGWSWQYPLLVRSEVAGKWRLPAHESLEILAPFDTWLPLPEDVYLKRTGTGTNLKRVEWSIEVLRKAADLGDEDSPRAMFYLAQMCMAADREDEALEAYIRRVGMGGNSEELFFTFLRIGEILLQRKEFARASRAFLDAYGVRPARSEPLFYLSHTANLLGNYEMAMVFANQGLMNPPSQDQQFIMRWVEEWGLRLQWAIAGFHLGNEKTPELLNELAEHAGIPVNWRAVIDLYHGQIKEAA